MSVDFYVEHKINKAICIIKPNVHFVSGVLPITTVVVTLLFMYIFTIHIILTRKRAIFKLPTPIHPALNKMFLFIFLYYDNYFYFSRTVIGIKLREVN